MKQKDGEEGREKSRVNFIPIISIYLPKLMSNHNKAIFRLKKKRKAYLCSKSKNNKKVSNYSSNNKSKSF